MTRCARCSRKLRHPVSTQAGDMGEKCARIAFGAKPKRLKVPRHAGKDERQTELDFEWQQFIGTTYGVAA